MAGTGMPVPLGLTGTLHGDLLPLGWPWGHPSHTCGSLCRLLLSSHPALPGVGFVTDTEGLLMEWVKLAGLGAPRNHCEGNLQLVKGGCSCLSCAGVLKDYLRELPSPLITKQLYEAVLDAMVKSPLKMTASGCENDPSDSEHTAALLDCLPDVEQVSGISEFK